jgi:hypothetical protein
MEVSNAKSQVTAIRLILPPLSRDYLAALYRFLDEIGNNFPIVNCSVGMPLSTDKNVSAVTRKSMTFFASESM